MGCVLLLTSLQREIVHWLLPWYYRELNTLLIAGTYLVLREVAGYHIACTVCVNLQACPTHQVVFLLTSNHTLAPKNRLDKHPEVPCNLTSGRTLEFPLLLPCMYPMQTAYQSWLAATGRLSPQMHNHTQSLASAGRGTVTFQLTDMHLAKHRLPVQGCVQPFSRERSAFPVYQQVTLSISETWYRDFSATFVF